jgi:hypothetical protein
MSKVKLLLSMFILCFSLPSYGTKGTSGEISRIYPTNNKIFFRLKNDTCNPNNRYYYFNLDSETSKAWYALILSAANTSKPISVSIHECPSAADVSVRYILQNF